MNISEADSGERFLTHFKGLGKDGLTGKYVFTEFDATGLGLNDEIIEEIVANHSHLKCLHLSNNSLTNLKALHRLRGLVFLDVSGNKISNVLDYTTPCCRFASDKQDTTDVQEGAVTDGPLKNGNMWIGSLIQVANLSRNLIRTIDDLSWHRHLRVLDLSHNDIKTLGNAFLKLPSLRSLNLAHNKLQTLKGIESLALEILNIDENQVRDVEALTGQIVLKKLSARNNNIEKLTELASCIALQHVNLEGNRIELFTELQNLKSAELLCCLNLRNNPVQRLEYYRPRVLYRLQNLNELDEEKVSPREMVNVLNFYGEDLENRKMVFQKHLPGHEFICHTFPYQDLDLFKEKMTTEATEAFVSEIITSGVERVTKVLLCKLCVIPIVEHAINETIKNMYTI